MAQDENRPKKRRWGEVKKVEPPGDKVQQLKLSVQERLKAARLKKQQQEQQESGQRPVKRAKQIDLDLSVTGPTYNKPKEPPKETNPYLAFLDDKPAGEEDVPTQKASKQLTFFKPGHWQAKGDRAREKEARAAAAGFVSGRSTGHSVQSVGLGSIYGPSDEQPATLGVAASANPDTKMPLTVEWWDVDLLPVETKKRVRELEAQSWSKALKGNESGPSDEDINALRQQCLQESSLDNSKTHALVQHIVPTQSPYANTVAKQPVLHLTKAEMKRQRKLRRQERQREQQDMQAAGLIPAPEPRLTLRNYIKVLGDQAFLDPSQMEQKVREQMQARQQEHLARNAANQLTKEQRAAKRDRKLTEDTKGAVHVSLYYVKDMSHPYHRAKVDLNAQQNKVTGGVLECPEFSCIIFEGGPKAQKRLKRLMTVRMKWQGLDEDEGTPFVAEDGEEAPQFNKDNTCRLIWEGLSVRPMFKGFLFQACETAGQARKILKGKGVVHYWDQVEHHHASKSGGFKVRVGVDSDDDEDNPFAQQDEDVVMKEE